MKITDTQDQSREDFTENLKACLSYLKDEAENFGLDQTVDMLQVVMLVVDEDISKQPS